jgi:hypothetical protein
MTDLSPVVTSFITANAIIQRSSTTQDATNRLFDTWAHTSGRTGLVVPFRFYLKPVDEFTYHFSATVGLFNEVLFEVQTTHTIAQGKR